LFGTHPQASLIGALFTPLSILLLPLLIPDAKMTDELDRSGRPSQKK
jgi:hypothetical protein